MQVKPGVRTTEFWLTLLVATVGPLVTVFVSTGLFPAGTVETVALIVANLTSLLAAGRYVDVRTKIKEAAEIAVAAAKEADRSHALEVATTNEAIDKIIRNKGGAA